MCLLPPALQRFFVIWTPPDNDDDDSSTSFRDAEDPIGFDQNTANGVLSNRQYRLVNDGTPLADRFFAFAVSVVDLHDQRTGLQHQIDELELIRLGSQADPDRCDCDLARLEHDTRADHRATIRRIRKQKDASENAREAEDERLAGLQGQLHERKRNSVTAWQSIYDITQDFLNLCLDADFAQPWTLKEGCCRSLRICLDRHHLIKRNSKRIFDLKVRAVVLGVSRRQVAEDALEAPSGLKDEIREQQRQLATTFASAQGELKQREAAFELQQFRQTQLESNLIDSCLRPLLARMERMSDDSDSSDVNDRPESHPRDGDEKREGSEPQSSHNSSSSDDVPPPDGALVTTRRTRNKLSSPRAGDLASDSKGSPEDERSDDNEALIRDFTAARAAVDESLQRQSDLDHEHRTGLAEHLTLTNSNVGRFNGLMIGRLTRERKRYVALELILHDARNRLLEAGVDFTPRAIETQGAPKSFADVDREYHRTRASTAGGRGAPCSPPGVKSSSNGRLKRWRAEIEPRTPPRTRSSAHSAGSPPDRNQSTPSIKISPTRRKRQQDWGKDQEQERKRLQRAIVP